MKRKLSKRLKNKLFAGVVTLIIGVVYGGVPQAQNITNNLLSGFGLGTTENATHLLDVPEYEGATCITINESKPDFTDSDLSLGNGFWQEFSDLDSLNRVGVANAMLDKAHLPIEKREDISNVVPTGWNQKKVNGHWFYNRAHLIAFQLTGENDNWKNLMTATAQMNQGEMVKYENQVKQYLVRTGNHVRYRVTPHFEGNNLVAKGVQIEAQSIEDNGISFNIYIYNVADNATIDYVTGKVSTH